jgi:molecular chaperone GrpE
MSEEELKTEDASPVDAAEDDGPDPLVLLHGELQEAQQQILYAQAELQNVRRRAEKEVQDAHTYATTKFARDILSVADNLGRALESIPAAMREDEAAKALVIGLEATQRELYSVFERNGISRMDSMGQPLDPNRHQAMVELPSDAEPGTIIQEMQAGYMIKDRLLRPALVGVAKKG